MPILSQRRPEAAGQSYTRCQRCGAILKIYHWSTIPGVFSGSVEHLRALRGTAEEPLCSTCDRLAVGQGRPGTVQR